MSELYEVRNDIKDSITDSGRKFVDLSRELRINYDTLNSYLNGRRSMPEEVENKIWKIIGIWTSS